MTAPSPPYSTTAAVMYMLHTSYPGKTDFDANTVPTVTQVTQMLTWVSSQIDMAFSSAGYVVPLAVISGETWPTHQTTYLQITTTMGAAAMAGGSSMRPAPALSQGRQGGTGNVFQDMFNLEMKRIYDITTDNPN